MDPFVGTGARPAVLLVVQQSDVLGKIKLRLHISFFESKTLVAYDFMEVKLSTVAIDGYRRPGSRLNVSEPQHHKFLPSLGFRCSFTSRYHFDPRTRNEPTLAHEQSEKKMHEHVFTHQ